jgi:antirestriction protein ArdC
MKIDLYQQVTDKIVAALENGTRPWKKSWIGASSAPLRHNGVAYTGINVLLLGLSDFSNPYWMTYKQAQEYGGQVRKGEKSTHIVFFKPLAIKDRATNEDKTIPLMRGYSVFNAKQIDGLPDRFIVKPEPRHNDERNAIVEKFIADTGANIKHGGDKAFYVPSGDYIQMPMAECFGGINDYYATLAHELTHWTGHESRLDRSLKTISGTKDYAREELVAELGSAFVCANLGIESEPRPDHVEYIAEWLSVLKADSRAIFQVSSAAQKAADFLMQKNAKKIDLAA